MIMENWWQPIDGIMKKKATSYLLYFPFVHNGLAMNWIDCNYSKEYVFSC